MPSTAVRWAGWERDGSRYAPGASLSPITFPATPLTCRVEVALGANPAADPATWLWQDITQWVRYDPGITINYGRRDESSRVDASSCRLTLDNRDGRFARRNPYGPWFGLLSKNTPIRVGVDPGDGVHYRYHGFVNEWPTRWTDESGTDSTVPIMCSGVLRRLQRGGSLRSAMFTTFSGVTEGDFVPVAYWPMEDGSSATHFASAVAGVPPLTVSGDVSPASYSGAPGSDPVPTLNAGAQISGAIPTTTLAAGSDGGKVWQFQFMAVIPSGMAADATFLQLDLPPLGGDNIGTLRVLWVNASQILTLRWYDAGGVQVGAGSAIDFATYSQLFDRPVLYGITIFTSTPSPSFISAQFAAFLPSPINGGASPFAFASNLWTATDFPAPTTFRASATSVNAGWSFSHPALYTDPTIVSAPNQQNNADAINGWEGEMAHERMIRLCREQGQRLTCTSATSASMGAQTSGTLLDNLRECETADMGVLYELEHGLAYQSLDDRLNAPVLWELDFDSRHIAETPEPADDDQRLVNRYSAARAGGSSETVQDDDSVAEAGVFTGSSTFSLYGDDQPRDVAGWKVHLGTVDEDRWPSLPIRLNGTPDLIPGWTSLPYGSRLTLANPPPEVAPDTIDAIAEGWTESIRPHLWEASLNTTPASPYRVGKIADETGDADPFLGWLESDSCVLAAGVSDSDLSWSITADPLWTTTADDFPVDVRVGGEVVTVDSCSGASAPQTWTLTARAVNGVTAAHSANDGIELVNPIVLVP